jgi:hypothetical protein
MQCLNNQTLALSNAIGVASYAVQLEQLENVLDATSDLRHLDMKRMWKRKLGTDKTVVPFTQFFEVLLNTLADRLKVLRQVYHVQESINRSRFISEVALSRYTNELFNENCDDDITVYEFGSALSGLTKPGVDTLQLTANRLVLSERGFLKSLKFTPLTIKPDDENFHVTPDSDGYKEGTEHLPLPYRVEHGVVKVRPFHRVLLRVELPEPDTEYYSYDKLVMLKHEKNPKDLVNKSHKKPVSFDLTVMKHTQCYLDVESNETMTSSFDRQWNAHKIFYNKEYDRFVPEGFSGHKNFESYVGEAEGDDEQPRKSEVSSVAGEGGGSNHCRILYVPFLLSPGFYSPRYCMDSYMHHEVNAKKLAQSPKSFYKGNLSDFTAADQLKTLARADVAAATAAAKKPSRRPSTHQHHHNPGATAALGPHEVTKESLGMLVECMDEFEIVFAEDESDDKEASKYDYDSDEGEPDSDDEKDNKKGKKKQKNFRPLLTTEFPYLPDRDGFYIDEPKLVNVYINAPAPAKKKKDKGDKKESKDKSAKQEQEQEGDVGEDKSAQIFSEAKFGVFFKATGELIHEKAVWPINKHNPLHRIRLHDDSLGLDLDECKERGQLEEDGDLNLRIGFLRSDNQKLYDQVPYLDLIISTTHESDDSSNDQSDDDSSDDDSGGGWSDNDSSLELDLGDINFDSMGTDLDNNDGNDDEDKDDDDDKDKDEDEDDDDDDENEEVDDDENEEVVDEGSDDAEDSD